MLPQTRIAITFETAFLAALMLLSFTAKAFAQKSADFERPLAVCEMVQAPTGIRTVVASDNEQFILTADARGALTLYQTAPLGKLWATDPASGLIGMGFSGSEEIFSVTKPNGGLTIRRISAASGIVRGFTDLPDVQSATVISASIATVSGGRLVLRNPGGAILAEAEFPANSVNGGRLDERLAVVGTEKNGVYVFDRLSFVGGLLGGESARLLALGPYGEVFVAGDSGIIEAYDGRSGNLRWKFRAGGRVTAATVAGQSLIAASNDNFLYALDLAGGDIKWKSRLDDRLLVQPRAKGEVVSVINSLAGILSVHSMASGKKLGSFEFDPGEPLLMGMPQSDGSIVVVTAGKLVRIAGNCGK